MECKWENTKIMIEGDERAKQNIELGDKIRNKLTHSSILEEL